MQVLQNQFLDARVVAQVFEFSVLIKTIINIAHNDKDFNTYIDTVLTSPRDQVLEVRNDHRDEVALQTVAVHVALQHVRALAVDCLQELAAR